MWLLKRSKAKKQTESPLQDKVAAKIAGAGIKMQTKFSDTMNSLFSNINGKKLKTFLIVFCISCGGYSLYLIGHSIFSPAMNQSSFKIDHIDVPKNFDRSGEDKITSENYVDDQTYYRIQGFRQYMDSLQQNKSKLYDSILQARPGLMDSVQMLEELYHSKKLK